MKQYLNNIVHYCSLLYWIYIVQHVKYIFLYCTTVYCTLYVETMESKLSNDGCVVHFEIRFFTILSYISLKGFALSWNKTQYCKKSDFKIDNTGSSNCLTNLLCDLTVHSLHRHHEESPDNTVYGASLPHLDTDIFNIFVTTIINSTTRGVN